MLEESALVIACEEDFAIVQTQSRAGCAACASQNTCSTSVLSGLFKRRSDRLRLKVLNPIQAQPGQRVVIGMQEHAFMAFSLIAYLLPLLGLLLSAILFHETAQHWQWQRGEFASILGGVCGFLIGLALVRRFSRRHGKDHSYQVVILRQESAAPIRFS